MLQKKDKDRPATQTRPFLTDIHGRRANHLLTREPSNADRSATINSATCSSLSPASNEYTCTIYCVQNAASLCMPCIPSSSVGLACALEFLYMRCNQGGVTAEIDINLAKNRQIDQLALHHSANATSTIRTYLDY